MNIIFPRVALLLIAVAGYAIPSPADASTYRWIDPAGGSWSDASNWFHQLAPPAGGAADSILTFPNASSDLFSATNDLGVFSVNQFQFENSYAETFNVTSSSGSSLSFTGSNPLIQITGTGANVISGVFALAADLSVTMGLGSLEMTSIITGAHSITVNGLETAAELGQFLLSGDNTFTGGVTLQSGNLVLDGSFFTDPAGAGTLTINGGYLSVLPATYLNTPIVINADLRFFGDKFTTFFLNGPVTVSDPSANFILQGGQITLQTPLDIHGSIVMGGSPNYLPSTGTAGIILKSNVTNGMAGTLLQTSSISMLGGAYLILENGPSSQSVSDRLSDTASITMRRGSMILNAATAGTSEAIGPVSVAGYSGLTAQPGPGPSGQPGILTLASLTRLNHGALLLTGKRLGDTSVSYHGGIVVTAGGPALVGGGGPPGSTTISIVPWAVASYSLNIDDAPINSFATYDPAVGFRALNPTEFASTLGTNPDENVAIAASTTNNGATMVNSLVFGDDQGITIGGTGSIAVTSGAFLFKGSADSAVNNSLIFGAAEGIITSGSDFDLLTLSGNLTGTGGLTTGGGTIALAGNNSGLTGQLTVNNLLEITSPSNLPGTGAISVYSFFSNSSSAGLSVTGNVNVTRDLTLASGKVNLAAITNTSAAIFSGIISGPASLDLNQDTALGTVELSGTNTYSGSTTVEHGTLVIHSDSSLGNGGGLSINATLRLAGDWTTSRLVYLLSSISAIDTGGHSAVLNNLVSGAGNLIKQGEGTLTLNQPFIHTGDSSPFIKSEVDAGTLVINNQHAGSMYVNAGTLGGGGTIAGFALVGDGASPGATLAPAAGGNQPKTLTFGEPITFNSDATYTCFIKARGSQIKSDKVVSNHVTINGGTFALTGQIQGTLTAGTVFTAINNTGSQKFDGRGTFTNLPEGGIVTLNGTNFQASYKGGTGNDLVLTVVP